MFKQLDFDFYLYLNIKQILFLYTLQLYYEEIKVKEQQYVQKSIDEDVIEEGVWAKECQEYEECCRIAKAIEDSEAFEVSEHRTVPNRALSLQ